MILLSHPTGNENVRQVARAFSEKGILAEFWTTLSWDPRTPLRYLLPRSVRDVVSRRSFDESVRARTRTVPVRETVRLLRGALGLSSQHETGAFSVDRVCMELDRKVADRLRKIGDCAGVYAYEDAARQSFRVARDRGLKRVYDLPIVYWETSRRLLQEEAKRYPEWEPTLGGTRDSQEKLSRKTQELELAELVICPSAFVLESLPAQVRAGKQCLVVPFGSPVVDPNKETPGEKSRERLRLLFAGALTQRKGLADLFAAMKLIGSNEIELVVMGSLLRPLHWYRDQFAHFTYEPPRPHREVLRLMQSCDVLVLPSIVEGRALVQQEAMACGLPVIATKNAGGDDLIEEGQTGFLVPIRSPKALAEKISWFLANRSRIGGMRIAARERASKFTWRSYGESIVAAVRALIRE